MLDDDCELILLDYQSPDNLQDYIFSNFEKELESGKLKYFYLTNDYNFSCAYAKNVAHRLASGNVLFNLDADGYITSSLIKELRQLKDNQLFVPRLYGDDEGTYGRLGYVRDTFYKLNGYNEYVVGMQDDDGNLRARALVLPLIPKHAKEKHKAIQNTREQKDMYINVGGLTQPPINYPEQWGKATVIDINGKEIRT